MPLNIKDEGPDEEEEGIPPITHAPGERGPFFTNTTLVILLVAILASGVFLLFKYRVLRPEMFFGKVPPAANRQNSLNDPWKTTPPAASPAPAAADTSASRAKEGAIPPKPEPHRYAVYISSYRNRADAEEEVSRWVAAGFSSFVADAGGWHRVAFGGYDEPKEAAEKAERWKEAFENGYWIGRAN